jgi:hypothetical protein
MSSANRRLRATLCHTAATRSYAGASDSGEQAADIAKALELVRGPEVREAVRLEQRLHERELNYRLRRDQLQQVLAAAETVHEQKQASTVLDCTERIHTQGFAVLPLLDAETEAGRASRRYGAGISRSRPGPRSKIRNHSAGRA